MEQRFCFGPRSLSGEPDWIRKDVVDTIRTERQRLSRVTSHRMRPNSAIAKTQAPKLPPSTNPRPLYQPMRPHPNVQTHSQPHPTSQHQHDPLQPKLLPPMSPVKLSHKTTSAVPLSSKPIKATPIIPSKANKPQIPQKLSKPLPIIRAPEKPLPPLPPSEKPKRPPNTGDKPQLSELEEIMRRRAKRYE